MLFPMKVLDLIESGEVSVAFRSWKRPTVRSGGTLHTAIGLLRIDEVTAIERDDITDADAAAAGAASPRDVIASLRGGDDRQLYRIRFHRVSDDPRGVLRERKSLTDVERAEIDAQLDRWDHASSDGPWTRQLLDHIAANPAQRSADIAERLATDQPRLKRRVRQLKGLGLTESLDVGYRLSPRGATFRDRSGGVHSGSDPDDTASGRP